MFSSKPSYTPVDSSSIAELDSWREDPEESIDSRNHRISIHRRPGFYSKSILLSVALNAILLMAVGYLYLQLQKYVVRYVQECKGVAYGVLGSKRFATMDETGFGVI